MDRSCCLEVWRRTSSSSIGVHVDLTLKRKWNFRGVDSLARSWLYHIFTVKAERWTEFWSWLWFCFPVSDVVTSVSVTVFVSDTTLSRGPKHRERISRSCLLMFLAYTSPFILLLLLIIAVKPIIPMTFRCPSWTKWKQSRVYPWSDSSYGNNILTNYKWTPLKRVS